MKRKIAIIITAVMLATVPLSGCSINHEKNIYKEAVAKLEEETLNEDGTYAVTEELLIALQNEKLKKPKNIIYMIGDGMGTNIIEGTQEIYAEKLYDNKLSINYLTKVGTQSTYSSNKQITDSAAGGTALSTGRKTSNGTVAMNPEHTENYKTVLELAAEKGKSTGIVATKTVTDATPASFTAHVSDRTLQEDIAKQQLEKVADGNLDLVLGGGYGYYENADNAATFAEAENSGMSYSKNWADTIDDELPLVGLYAEGNLDTFDEDIPTLAEMTDLALELLSEDEDGFFLMVEGSWIDTQAHANMLYAEAHEMYQFDAAIAVAMKFVAMNPDTVIVVTADHETGGLYFPKEGLSEDAHAYSYMSIDHTCINVPVYALGYGVDKLSGIIENTDIAGFVASLLGKENFEQDSKVTEVYNAKDSDAVVLSFDENATSAELLTDTIASGMKQVKNARAIHILVQNIGQERVTLPLLKITNASSLSYDMVPQYAYIEADEMLSLTYILPTELWTDNALQEVTTMQLSYSITAENNWKNKFKYNTEVAELEISEISITDRILEK